MSTPTSTTASRTKRRVQMWARIFSPLDGCSGYETVSFDERILAACGEGPDTSSDGGFPEPSWMA